jgi:hypothetical protein
MCFYITFPISGSTVRLEVPSVDHAQFAILELKRETGISGLDYQSRPIPSCVAFLALTVANKNEILSLSLDARGLVSSESLRDIHLEHLSLRQPGLESLLQKYRVFLTRWILHIKHESRNPGRLSKEDFHGASPTNASAGAYPDRPKQRP